MILASKQIFDDLVQLRQKLFAYSAVWGFDLDLDYPIHLVDFKVTGNPDKESFKYHVDRTAYTRDIVAKKTKRGELPPQTDFGRRYGRFELPSTDLSFETPLKDAKDVYDNVIDPVTLRQIYKQRYDDSTRNIILSYEHVDETTGRITILHINIWRGQFEKEGMFHITAYRNLNYMPEFRCPTFRDDFSSYFKIDPASGEISDSPAPLNSQKKPIPPDMDPIVELVKDEFKRLVETVIRVR